MTLQIDPSHTLPLAERSVIPTQHPSVRYQVCVWVKHTGAGVFSIQEKTGESPQVSFPKGFVYSSQIKGFVLHGEV